jgi:hypothetical protein
VDASLDVLSGRRKTVPRLAYQSFDEMPFARVLAAWRILPSPLKAAVLAIVDSAGGLAQKGNNP